MIVLFPSRKTITTTVLFISLALSAATITTTSSDKPPPPTTTTTTDWSSISPLLNDPTLSSQLPTVPTLHQATAVYPPPFDFSNGQPFAQFSISDFPNTALFCPDLNNISNSSFTTARAGPSEVCDPSTCVSGLPHGSIQCRAELNSNAILLKGKLGTWWSKALGTPAWAQFTFPPITNGTDEVRFRFTLDGRYRPELYGGNACHNSTSIDGYICQLCQGGVWEYNMTSGVHVLWSAAGRDGFVVDPNGPYDLGEAFDQGELVRMTKVPEWAGLGVGDYPVVTLMTFSQYPAFGEVPDTSRCSVAYSDKSGYPYKDKPLMITAVSLLYRSSLTITKTPPPTYPRLYGTTSEWLESHVTPFFRNTTCRSDTPSNGGWWGSKGFWSGKAVFDYAARGFDSCSDQSTEGFGNLSEWSSLTPYYEPVEEGGNPGYPKEVGGFRAVHMLRRLWACHSGNNYGADPSYSSSSSSSGTGGSFRTKESCEYDAIETERLATVVAEREMLRFRATTWSCGYTCGGNGQDEAYDLTSAEKVEFFVTLYDVLVSSPSDHQLLSPQDRVAVSDKLEEQIDLFVQTFWKGGWQLWNGNNWTPHLCLSAVEWAVVFWHEKTEKATEVLRIACDVMWLHRKYYAEDGVYLEGLAMYTYMSLEGIMAMATLTRAGFGFAPAAIDVEKMRKTANYMIASMATDGHCIDFGDSHRKRGFDSQTAVVEAVLVDVVVNGGTVDDRDGALDTIDAERGRAFSASMYGSGGFYSNPWKVRGHILEFDKIIGLRDEPEHATRPLGNGRVDVFPSGGYARLLVPFLDAAGGDGECFGEGSNEQLCIDPKLPSLSDNVPYASLSLQARKNRFGHSEVDFGTFIWSAWGVRLLSEYGYGTIATSVNQWDMRRYAYLDNNPAGHNTVVVQEAFQTGGGTDAKTINFSQLNYVDGNITEISLEKDEDVDDLVRCVLADGSNLYGAARPDGWLDIMKRHVCTLSDDSSSFLILDILQTKPDRQPLSLYGSQYGGPDFNEGPTASARLTLDEYFYTDTSAEVEVVDGEAREVLPYDRGNTKWCWHVDVNVTEGAEGTASVDLRPVCGIGSWRNTDGNGIIAGISVGGQGSFVYDGLITNVNRWLTPHAIRKRRFRFVTDSTVGPEGDVRAFILTPYSAATAAVHGPPDIHLANCSTRLGCPSVEGGVEAATATPIACSCIQMCLGETVSWIVVLQEDLRLVRRVGTCDGSGSVVLDEAIITDIRTRLSIETSYPTVNKAPTLDPTESPTVNPTKNPTITSPPTATPTTSPITSPPTISPTGYPTKYPTISPTSPPTGSPTTSPTTSSTTESPTSFPTKKPTINPTSPPTDSPTTSPTTSPTISPTVSPTKKPTINPTSPPTGSPTTAPTPAQCKPKCKNKKCNLFECVAGKCVRTIDLSKCAKQSCKVAKKCLPNGKCKYRNLKNCCMKKKQRCSSKKKCCKGLKCRKKNGKKQCV